MKKSIVALLLASVALVSSACAETPSEKNFYFDQRSVPDGFTFVKPQQEYSDDAGYGWVANQPNVFAVELPEGNYDVAISFDTPKAAANATVKAEARRLMLMKQEKADSRIRQFTVNVRRPEIKGYDRVKLNKREMEPTMVAHWDNLLTLEFLPDAIGVESVTIISDPDAVTVYIAGDSTVTDQRSEPWCGWGQILPRFFGQGIAVANHAESGRALFSFLWEKRLDKILSTIKPGDYLLIQFGHNDQKDRRDGSGPFTTYMQELEEYITKVRDKGGNPVLVTPMERRRWNGGKPQETLSDYATAMRQVAKDLNVPLIDLHAMSLRFYAAMGEMGSTKAFVHYPAHTFPGQDKELKDDTHHNAYGAYELARCVVEGIKEQVPELAKHLRKDAGSFNPSQPDNPDSLQIPASLEAGVEKPEGN